MNDDRKVVPIIGEHQEGGKPIPLVETPTDIRNAAGRIFARAELIRRTLTAPATPPAMRARAKDELVKISQEALALWSLV